jgi:NADH-quinone oxidoreductase subunit N
MEHRWAVLMWILAALSMTVGNLGAMFQRDVKRLLAYSSIAHAGYILVAFTALRSEGIAAVCFYTATYAAMQVGAFAVVTQVTGYNEQIRSIDDYTGLGFKRPLLAGFLGLFLISLIGIPFTGGFFGKFYVFSSAVHANHVWLAVVGLLNSGIACFYYLRLLAALYTRPATEDTRLDRSRGLGVPAGIGLTLAAAATLVLGIFPGHFLNLAQRAGAAPAPTAAASAPATVPPAAVTLPMQ